MEGESEERRKEKELAVGKTGRVNEGGEREREREREMTPYQATTPPQSCATSTQEAWPRAGMSSAMSCVRCWNV